MGNPSCLLYLVDVASSKRYLVDFGSAFSILPHKSTAEPTGPRLMTVDGKPLHCWGHRTCTVHTRTRQFSWSFLLAPEAFPILAADFLSKFKLLVDISNKRLVARGSQLIQLEPGRPTKAAVVTGVVAATPPPAVVPSPPSHPTVEAPPTTPSLHTVEAPSSRPPQGSKRHVGAAKQPKVALPPAVASSTPSLPTVEAPSSGSRQLAATQHVGAAKRLLMKYQAVVGANKWLPPVKHAVEHLIETTATLPVASQYRRLDPERLAAAKAEFAARRSSASLIFAKGTTRCQWPRRVSPRGRSSPPLGCTNF